jgi:hypothetical protein
MPLQAKHLVEEINGTRCTIVEKGAAAERVAFLKDLLEFNDFEVMVAEETKVNAEDPSGFTIGVTDLVFNPTIAVYELSLKAREGGKVSPAYWDQKMTRIVDQYWLTEEESEPGKSAWFYPES